MRSAWSGATAAWVDGVRRAALWVVLVSIALTVGSVLFIVENFDISTDNTDMLSPDLPFRQRMVEMKRLFPNSGDQLLIVVEGDTADLTADGTAALYGRLKGRDDLFNDLFAPSEAPFFQTNGLLYLELAALEDLADRLAVAQPFLGTLSKDPSLVALFDLLGLAAAEAAKGEKARLPVKIDAVLAAIAEAVETGRPLSWTDLMNGGDSRLAGKRLMIVARPNLDYGSLAPASAAMKAVRAAAADLPGVRVYLSGSVALDHEELGSVEEGMGWAGVISLTLVLGLLILCFRSLRMVGAVLATLIIGLIWTGAFAFLAVGQLNLISVAFAVLFIGLSVDFGIHFGLRYREERQKGAEHDGALRRAAEAVGGPLTLCAVAAAMAFYAFLPTDYIGLAQLGLIAGSGMFVALLANLTVLPALLTLMPPTVGTAERGFGGPNISRHARPILAFGALVAVASAPLAMQVGFDFDPLHLKDPNSESLATLNRLMAEGEVKPYKLQVLVDGTTEARDLKDRLSELVEVGSVRVLADYEATAQDDKLAVIENLSFIVGPSLMASGDPVPMDHPTTRAAIERLIGHLSGLETPAAERLRAALSGIGDDEAALDGVQTALMTGLPGRLAALRRSLDAAPFSVEDLPSALLARLVAIDGRQKVEISPSAEALDRDSLKAFVAAVRGVAPNVTGTPVTIIEAGDAVIGAFKLAGVITLIGVAVLLLVVLRRGRDLLYVFLPLALAAELTVAVSVLIDVPFNFANVIVLPLLVGLGVASGIHLVTRAREEKAGTAMMASSTPRAVVFSALTTVGSFGSIALSSHPGTAGMGVLLTVALICTLACTMTLVPSLMALELRRGE